MNDVYEVLQERIVNWGNLNEEIIAIYMVGSRARVDKPFDEFSDLDIVVFSTNPDYYLQNDEWLLSIGKVWTSFMYNTAGGDPERLVLFDQGAEVDFLFHPVSNFDNLIKCGETPQGFQLGAKILLDKTGIGEKILPQTIKTAKASENNRITESAYLQVVNMFGFACLYVAKQILRNEMWVANQRDKDCKQLLLLMVELHAKALHGPDYDTWHAGKFIDEWADIDVVTNMKQSFGDYDQKNSWKALCISFELFSRLSWGVANTYNFAYPDKLFFNIRTWLEAHQLEVLNPSNTK
ncbi:aminoglycoside 6-adenylyltransferase [Paenibacillus eucommiae]|uniref:Aminoglycoside 6-adenylyltransferase n=1 Tax=Paenibacillus eucommiae TaxID=1355755 RepID=A0ABS4J9Z2_9BACL|nr:aminoglycoside 6-adenylyltransferase [Paenibacillus eucommiae]MBP1996667.1 aminoglycoside 6-adenylyltransferase [Paenibacillus eucommiae]